MSRYRLKPCIFRLSSNRFRLLAIRFSVRTRTVDNIYIAYFVIMIKIIYIFIILFLYIYINYIYNKLLSILTLINKFNICNYEIKCINYINYIII